jgi:hypothetical protein
MIWATQFRGIFGWLPRCLQLNRSRGRRRHSRSSRGCLFSPRDRLGFEIEAQHNPPPAYLLFSLEDAEFQIRLCELRYPPIRYALHECPQRRGIRTSSPDVVAQSIHHDASANREEEE